MSTQTPRPCPAQSDAAAEAIEQALALAHALSPLLLQDDGPAACAAALCALAEAEGLTVETFALRGRAVTLVQPPGRPLHEAPDRLTERQIALASVLRRHASWTADASDVPDEHGAAGLARLLPSGLWGACLSVASLLAFGRDGRSRLVAWIETLDDGDATAATDAAGDAAIDAATARLQRRLDRLHLAVCGQGGVPHHDGDQLLVPLPLAQRGVSWFELRVARQLRYEQTDLSLPQPNDAIEALLAGIARLPDEGALPPRFGPLFEGVTQGLLRWATTPRGAIWSALLDDDDDVRRAAMARSDDATRQTLRELTQPTWTLTRLDAGERPDRAAQDARAIVEVRIPGDGDLAAVRVAFDHVADGSVMVRELASRPGICAALDNPVRAALVRALAASGLPLGVVPRQTRVDEPGLLWQQTAVPVFGFAPVWLDVTLDVDAACAAGALATDDAGLRWGAALFARVAGVLDGRASS